MIEKHAGDWVAFRAMAMGTKKGVVAYVPRGDAADAAEPTVPRPQASAPAPRPQAAPADTILVTNLPPSAAPRPQPAAAPRPQPAPAPAPAHVPPPPAPDEATGKPQPPSVFKRQILKNGNFGPSVIYLQQLLNYNGVPVLVDRTFGNNTKAAVQAFQGREGLTPDGIVGPGTWDALGA